MRQCLCLKGNSGGSELEIADEQEHDKTVFFEVSQE